MAMKALIGPKAAEEILPPEGAETVPSPEILDIPDTSQPAAAESMSTPFPDPYVENNILLQDGQDADSKPTMEIKTTLIGGLLNSTLPISEYTMYSDGFYYAPISENLQKYMTGNSFPRTDAEKKIMITFDELRYVHVWYLGFDGTPDEGELVCNKEIAEDLLEIFMELYENQYPLEKIRLVDEYFGDDLASMEDNNSSCFNYRENSSAGAHSLSLHAYGLAVDINPLYNPYVSSDAGENRTILPGSGAVYADRAGEFAYKIDENDLCYKLFTEHGFIWGGSWTGAKDYQHFEKAPK